MFTIKRTTSSHLDFQELVYKLDQDLALKNGSENSFFATYNTLDLIQHVVVAYERDLPVGCGAIKEYAPGVIEIKRMYVAVDSRGKGVAGKILHELQLWAKELGYEKAILETGDQMVEAIGLYQKHHFIIIPNYEPYTHIKSSICFAKTL